MSEQLELFNRFTSLTFSEARPLYWEMEGRLLPGHSHKTELKHLEDYFKDKYLHQITAYDVESFRLWKKMENPTLRESSINREHTRLTRMFNAFAEWKQTGNVKGYDFSDLKLPPTNPGEIVIQPSEAKYQRNLIVTPEMFNRFCDYAHPRVRRICVIAILTLLRRKDIRLLKDENLNRALNSISGVQSKTGLTFNVPAPVTVRIIFNEAKEEEKSYICDFTNFRRYFERAKRESGIYFQFRDLRRSGATQLLLEGIDIRTIQRLLGHASLTTTETYLKPPAPLAHEAVKKLEKSFMNVRNEVEMAFCEN